MAGYICTKHLNLGGVAYHPGQEIPEGAVLPFRVPALTRQGYLVAKRKESGDAGLQGTVKRPGRRGGEA